MTSIKYYAPSDGLVKYLHEELRNRVKNDEDDNAVKEKDSHYKRSKKTRKRIAKKKFDYIDHLFRAFTDLLYFLEFVESNHEKLGVIFKDDLKRLFGYYDHYTEEEFKENISYYQPGHFRNVGPPLQRFVDAILLLNNDAEVNPYDFRTAIIQLFIERSIQSLALRMSGEELTMMSEDARRLKFWVNYLAKQVKDPDGESNRRIGYVPYRPGKADGFVYRV